MFALTLAEQVREMINSSEMMQEGLVPVECSSFSTWRDAAAPWNSQAGLATRAEQEAAGGKTSTASKGWNSHTHTHTLKKELRSFFSFMSGVTPKLVSTGDQRKKPKIH